MRHAVSSVRAARQNSSSPLRLRPPFFIELGASHIEHIVALVIGGCAAAPFGAFVVRRVNQHALMALVGVLVSLVSLFQLVKALG